MRGLAAAALALAVALPAVAQRGGGHASFSARSAPAVRSAPAFHGNFASRPAFGYNSAPLGRAPVAYPSGMRILPPPVHYPVTAPVHRPVVYQPNHGGAVNTTRGPFHRGYPYSNFGFYPTAIYLPYGGLFDDSYEDYDTLQQPAPQPDYSNNYPPDSSYPYPQPAPPPEYSYAYPQPTPEYAQPTPAAPQMQYVPGSSETVTLIYKDGRAPAQIQNYLATRTTLTILDNGRRREVPLTDLDIPATI